MKERYLPKTPAGKLARLSEEACEVAAAISKTLRVQEEDRCSLEAALEGGNPELRGTEEFETNRDWILREITDLEHAIVQAKKVLLP